MALPFEFKAGDLVVIKNDLSTNDPYPCGVTSEMADMRGQVCTVESVQTYDDYQYIRLKEDTYGFSWFTPMFDGLANSFYYLRQDYNIVELRDGKLMIKYKNSIMSQRGFAIGVDKYDGAKHVFDDKFDIVKVYAPSTTNYRFDKGEVLWVEEGGQ